MKTLPYALMACAALILTLVTAPAQETLGDLVEQNGHGWLIGDWSGTDNDGGGVSLSMAWELNKNMISMHRKDAKWEVKGMTAIAPESGDIIYVAVSSVGSTVLGKWDEQNGNPVLTINTRFRSGRTWKGAIVFKQAGQDAMIVEYYALDDAGNREGEIRQNRFTRKK